MIKIVANPPEKEFNPPALLQKAALELPDAEFELYCEGTGQNGKPQWAMDNYRLDGQSADNASVVFYTQPGWGAHFEKKHGRYNVQCQTYACDPDFHKPAKVAKEFDVGFIGQIDGDDRPKYLDAIRDAFPNSFISDHVELEKLPEILSKCRVLFNHIRYEEINIRFFECLALGAQVTTHSPALHLFAKEGEHYLTCSNPDQAVAKIQELLNDDKKREKMAKEARKHVLAYHTYRHRLESMLNFIKQHE